MFVSVTGTHLHQPPVSHVCNPSNLLNHRPPSPPPPLPPPQLFKAVTACKMSPFHLLPVFLVISRTPPRPGWVVFITRRVCFHPVCPGATSRLEPSPQTAVSSGFGAVKSVRRDRWGLNSKDKMHPTQNEVVSG